MKRCPTCRKPLAAKLAHKIATKRLPPLAPSDEENAVDAALRELVGERDAHTRFRMTNKLARLVIGALRVGQMHEAQTALGRLDALKALEGDAELEHQMLYGGKLS